MRRFASLILIGALAAASLADDAPRPRPVEKATVLPEPVRAELRGLVRHVEENAKPGFSKAAMTIEQARYYADVHHSMTWQAEFGEWFVFGRPDVRGRPDPWSGIVFVKKD